MFLTVFKNAKKDLSFKSLNPLNQVYVFKLYDVIVIGLVGNKKS